VLSQKFDLTRKLTASLVVRLIDLWLVIDDDMRYHQLEVVLIWASIFHLHQSQYRALFLLKV